LDRYFFDLRDGAVYPDALGTELLTLHDAKVEAAQRIAGLLQADPEKFWGGEEWQMTVKDKRGLILFTICIVGFASAAIGGS
jgi:hypothetical protein